MFDFIFKIFGSDNERYLKKIQPLVNKINSLESEFEKLNKDEFPKMTKEFKERIKNGETLDDLLPEAFALVREAAKRTLGQRHYDVQLIGGIVLHQGKIAEMKTGEGKTLAATLAAYLNALSGRGVHIVTVNDYLAKRDTVWMGQIYYALGLITGCIVHENAFIYDPFYLSEKNQKEENQDLNLKSQNNDKEIEIKNADKLRDEQGGFKIIEGFLRPCLRKEAYLADITYGTNNEFGFDYLRDNMAYSFEQMIQRCEFDSPFQQQDNSEIQTIESALTNNQSISGSINTIFNYAIVDEVDSILIDEARTPLIISIPDTEAPKLYQQFSRIISQFQENIDYNIDEKMRSVTLTDEGINKIEKILNIENIYTLENIRILHHLEQALKAHTLFKRDRDYIVKDGEVIIVDEFTGRLMPGRRYSEGLHQAIEAKEGVAIKEESRTMATVTFQNYFRMYKKLAGMTGTAATSAEEFEKVYGLEVISIPTNKPMIRIDMPDLVYKTHEAKMNAIINEIREKHKIGQPILVGTVSVEKNEELSRLLTKAGIKHEVLNAKNHEREAEIIAQAGKLGVVTVATNMAGRGVDIILGGNPPDKEEAEKVRELGGLYVIGTERHESRRIDNQLRGRSGRQGDPGLSRFFISLEDDLLRIFGGDRIKKLMQILGLADNQPIEHKLISKSIAEAQKKVEGYNFDIRKHILEFDEVLNKQRNKIYAIRREFLFSKNIKENISTIIKEEIKNLINAHTKDYKFEQWNINEIFENIKAIIGDFDNLYNLIKEEAKKGREKLENFLKNFALEKFEEKEKAIGAEFNEGVKFMILRILDLLWMNHLETMDHIRDAVRIRAYGQHDPLVEYKNEGQKAFKELLHILNFNIFTSIFRISTVEKKQEISYKIVSGEQINLLPKTLTRSKKKIGRNDPCPCGAKRKDGRPIKYKNCCGR